jgi:hypothetical protein
MYVNSNNTTPITGDQYVATYLRKYVEPVLMNAGGAPADLVLQGHHHSYQRDSAVFAGVPIQHSVGPDHVYQDPPAPVQILVGTGGAGYSTNVESAQPAWNEEYFFEWGYGRITVYNASALQWQFVADSNGTVLDSAWILKSAPLA